MLLYIHFQNLFLTDVTFPSACMQFRAMKTSDVCVHCFFGAGPLAANIELMRPCWPFFIGFLLGKINALITIQLSNSRKILIAVVTLKSPLYITVLMAVQELNSQWILLQAIAEKRPEWATRHEKLIFHHDDVRPHVAVPVKDYLENDGWELLPHPPYSPDIAPSDYHLFRSMQNFLSGIRFTNVEGIKNGLMTFLAQKMRCFFGIEFIK